MSSLSSNKKICSIGRERRSESSVRFRTLERQISRGTRFRLSLREHAKVLGCELKQFLIERGR